VLPGTLSREDFAEIGAMILRYWYLLLSSWPRLLELLYWPALQIITWGFLQNYIAQNAGFFARAGGTLIGAVILWDILFRGQLGFSISFLEEMWARNLGNLMMSPLRPAEFVVALMVMSLIRQDSTDFYFVSASEPDIAVARLIELVKERLENTKHRLICIRCGKWERLIETKQVAGILSCKLCGSRLITATFSSDYELPKIILNKLSGASITSEENHKFERAWKVASLINNFGKKALLVLSGYGVGVDTAARILRNYVDDENVFKSIYNAERQYVTTRAFWKD
jgi:ribosomal protein L37AE/L43A